MRITLHVKMVVLWLFLSSVSSFAQDTTIEDREAGYRVKLPERAKEGRKNIYTLPNGITFISIEVDQLDLPGKSSRELLDFAVQSAAEIFSDDKKPIGLRFRKISGVLAAEFSSNRAGQHLDTERTPTRQQSPQGQSFRRAVPGILVYCFRPCVSSAIPKFVPITMILS